MLIVCTVGVPSCLYVPTSPHTEQSMESVSGGAIAGGVVGGLVGVVLLAVTVVLIVVLVNNRQRSLKYDGKFSLFSADSCC